MPRLLTWNVNLGLQKKWTALLALSPDVAVLPEVSHAQLERLVPDLSRRDWIGDNENKGLGVVVFGDYKLSRDASYDATYQFFLPLYVSGPVCFSLLAVWALNHRHRNSLAGQADTTWKAIQHYRRFLERTSLRAVAGDFNHNAAWDAQMPDEGRFTRVIDTLGQSDLRSAYHNLLGHLPGQEPEHTLRMYRNRAKGYHVDYIFASTAWVARSNLRLVDPGDGDPLSDHVALILDLPTTNPSERHS